MLPLPAKTPSPAEHGNIDLGVSVYFLRQIRYRLAGHGSNEDQLG